MSRQVDVKALVSHIVRGDGIDKCRICMGDTSEGQVYLGDTVMLDGNKPVTLSELLETITGIEVPIEDQLPSGLCTSCSVTALEAGNFRSFCQSAVEHWERTLDMLESMPITPEQVKTLHIAIGNDSVTFINNLNHSEEQPPPKQKERRVRNRVKNVINKDIECPDCGKKFNYPQEIYSHLRESTELKRACPVCAEVMMRDQLAEHLKKEHSTKCFPCQKCPAILLKHSEYQKHTIDSHSKGSYSCGECGRSFNSVQARHAHNGLHAMKSCPGCDKIFRNQSCYLYHVKHCCDLRRNRTDRCQTKNRITIEVKNIITDKKSKVGLRGSADRECYCDYCGKNFRKKKYVAVHIQTVHTKQTHRPCAYCGKYLAAVHMTEHMKKHEQDIRYTCELCGVTLRSRLSHSQHVRLHTGEMPYRCKYCGESFSASSRRSVHIRKVHKKMEDVLRHACKYCPAKFHLPFKLRKHIDSVHSEEAGERPVFQCTVCCEKFSSCRGLVQHGRKHQRPIYSKKGDKSAMLKT